MALIVEDGTLVAGANSYITAEDYIDWAGLRFGYDRSTAPDSSSDFEGVILRATDYIEELEFKGSKVSYSQTMQWPRDGVYIDGYSVGSAEIPAQLKTAIFEAAYAEESGSSALAATPRQTKREKVGDLEVEYTDGSTTSSTSKAITRSIKKLLKGGGGLRVVRV